MLLPKQQAQAKAWRLFIVSGSLTWFRRPRLASFTSTTIVETIHPLDASQPIWLNSHPTVQCRKCALAVLFGMANRSSDVAISVSFGDGLSSVLRFLALGER
jgi:fluoride ion exporter CrcB/FEX